MRNRSEPAVVGDDFRFRTRQLKKAIHAAENGNSLLLFGLKRIGKSSFLQELQRRSAAEGRRRVLETSHGGDPGGRCEGLSADRRATFLLPEHARQRLQRPRDPIDSRYAATVVGRPHPGRHLRVDRGSQLPRGRRPGLTPDQPHDSDRLAPPEPEGSEIAARRSGRRREASILDARDHGKGTRSPRRPLSVLHSVRVSTSQRGGQRGRGAEKRQAALASPVGNQAQTGGAAGVFRHSDMGGRRG